MNDGGPEVISPLATLFALVFLGFPRILYLDLGVVPEEPPGFFENGVVGTEGQNTADRRVHDLLGCFGCMVVAQVLAFGLGAAIWGGTVPVRELVSRV